MKSSRRYLNVAVSFPSTCSPTQPHNWQLDSFPCNDWGAYLDTPLPVQVHGWHLCLLVHSSMGLDTLIRTCICITTFTQGSIGAGGPFWIALNQSRGVTLSLNQGIFGSSRGGCVWMSLLPRAKNNSQWKLHLWAISSDIPSSWWGVCVPKSKLGQRLLLLCTTILC